METYTIRLGGQAGLGIATSIEIIAKILSKQGYYLFSTKDYCSQIKGGHNYHTLVVSNKTIGAETGKTDLLIAPDQETFNRHIETLNKNGIIVTANNTDTESSKFVSENKIKVFKLECKVQNKSSVLSTLIGATAKILNAESKILQQAINEKLCHHPEGCKQYLNEAQEGFNLIISKKENQVVLPKLLVTPKSEENKLISGNDAVLSGALKSGITFHVQYPMTPVSDILHQLAKHAVNNPKLKVIVPEDEIAAINMSLGASYAGARAMTATSGGGFGLMVETLGLVGMAEVPLVVIEGQRPGPATGLPTKTEQGDLKFVLSAGTGDFPKIIIAPKSNEDCYTETKRAFYLAEKYQLPVIVLIDKHLAESYKSINLDKEEKNYIFDAKERINLLTEKDAIHLKSHLNKDGLFKRYAVNPDLLHRTIPGTPNGIYTCAGDEHDEVGEITEDYQMRDKMMQRRMGKLPQILSELPAPEIIGEKNANYTLITWGSSHDAVLEAMQELNSNGDKKTKINLLCLTYMHPFQTSAVKNILSKSKNTILIENNYCGQLGELIAEKTGILVDHKILKSNGTTFTVEELITKIRAIIK